MYTRYTFYKCNLPVTNAKTSKFLILSISEIFSKISRTILLTKIGNIIQVGLYEVSHMSVEKNYPKCSLLVTNLVLAVSFSTNFLTFINSDIPLVLM